MSSTLAVVLAVIATLGSIIAASIAAYLTFRSARAQNKIQQSTSWRQDVIELRKMREEDKDAYEERFNEHKTDCDKKIEELTQRLNEQERRHAREKMILEQRIEALTDWGSEVVVIMNAHGIKFPDPPDGVRKVPES